MQRLTWSLGQDGCTDVCLHAGVTEGDAICRLAEYEDIGMTPQEIKVKLATLAKALEYARAERDLLYKRMIEEGKI